MTGAVPPPGWYPDPANDQQLRWWTGERWTGAARPVEIEDPAGVAEQQLLRDTGAGTAAEPSSGPWEAEATAPLSQDTMAMSASTAASEHQARTASAPAVGGAAAWEDTYDDEPDDASGWPRERMIAAIAIGGLLLTSLAIWLFAVVLTGSGDGEATTGDAATGSGEETTDVGDTGEGEGEGPDAGEAGDDVGESATDDSATNGDEPEVVADERTVDFDGRCTVELDAVDADRPLRPWQFDECDGAPVDLDGGDGRWIVVIASMDGEMEQAQARSRTEDHGAGYGLLWSTHYPSLNPGWWVVFDGPFSEEDAATDVADSIGGGAYPRLLSDDEGDRYCIAEDGC